MARTRITSMNSQISSMFYFEIERMHTIELTTIGRHLWWHVENR